MKNKWELKLYDRVEYPYYELTNGSISLIADCGFVGETEEEESALFKKVTDTLNESGIDFRSNSKLELEQHIEIMQLQDQLREANIQSDYLQTSYDHVAAKSSKLVEALTQINNSPNPANEREMVSWIETARALASSALSLGSSKEQKEGEV